ncbi:MAG TPA: RNA polymerase subunit sigma-70 [Ruminococcus sp.]|nr:RNA polymerase subunit sigma-70 [Ruminococcus sp.]
MEDQQIIEMYLKRNEDAISQTERKYTKYCRSIAVRILHISEDADEALNDTWLAAWNSIPPHIPGCLQTFLGKLTRNISLKRVRSEKAMKRGAAEVRAVFEEVADWLQSDQNVEQQVSEQALADEIDHFLDRISETERNVFVRRYWYMQSITEIADYHGFSESKVKSMLFRIRKKLYAKLKEKNYL